MIILKTANNHADPVTKSPTNAFSDTEAARTVAWKLTRVDHTVWIVERKGFKITLSDVIEVCEHPPVAEKKK